MRRCIPALLARARENAAAADDLLAGGYANIAVSRAYYSMFYAAQAILASEGLSFSKHSATIAGYGEHFAKTKRLDPKFHRFLLDSFRRRGDADYDVRTHSTPEQAREVIGWAREFIEAATEYLGDLAIAKAD